VIVAIIRMNHDIIGFVYSPLLNVFIGKLRQRFWLSFLTIRFYKLNFEDHYQKRFKGKVDCAIIHKFLIQAISDFEIYAHELRITLGDL
jgi:hypothetical protein